MIIECIMMVKRSLDLLEELSTIFMWQFNYHFLHKCSDKSHHKARANVECLGINATYSLGLGLELNWPSVCSCVHIRGIWVLPSHHFERIHLQTDAWSCVWFTLKLPSMLGIVITTVYEAALLQKGDLSAATVHNTSREFQSVWYIVLAGFIFLEHDNGLSEGVVV